MLKSKHPPDIFTFPNHLSYVQHIRLPVNDVPVFSEFP